MCVAKKPKVNTPKEKDPAVIRNPLLDGLLGNIAAIRNGTNMFRIDLLNPLTIPGGGAGSGGAAGGGSGGGGTGGSSGGTGSGTGTGTGSGTGTTGGGGRIGREFGIGDRR